MRPLIVGLLSFLALGSLALWQDVHAQGLTVHEWGVWKARRNQVTHLADLAAETPRFVSRTGVAPAVVPDAADRPIRVSYKPVLFFYTDAPQEVSVRVTFVGGRPWLYHPPARQSGRVLSWTGTVGGPEGAMGEPPDPHWWGLLRDVGAASFRSPDGGTERFIFYDGPVRFRRTFRFSERAGELVARPSHGETRFWILDGNSVEERSVDRRGRSVDRNALSLDSLRTTLKQEMLTRGLNDAEAEALLQTWDHELFRVTYRRAVYFVPRRNYDRMLPIRIQPRPDELVRVGLGIEEL
ncbi:MAG: hypothetical protein AAGF12_13510 [Myxococcota bacterium]